MQLVAATNSNNTGGRYHESRTVEVEYTSESAKPSSSDCARELPTLSTADHSIETLPNSSWNACTNGWEQSLNGAEGSRYISLRNYIQPDREGAAVSNPHWRIQDHSGRCSINSFLTHTQNARAFSFSSGSRGLHKKTRHSIIWSMDPTLGCIPEACKMRPTTFGRPAGSFGNY